MSCELIDVCSYIRLKEADKHAAQSVNRVLPICVFGRYADQQSTFPAEIREMLRLATGLGPDYDGENDA